MPESIFSLNIFKGIDEETVEKIILNSKEKKFNEGEIIMIEGEDSNGEGYIIKYGEVSVNIGGKHITTLKKGDIFGEIALLNEEKRTATVKAIVDTEVIILTLDNLIEMINHDENLINKEIIRRMEENLENS